MGGDGVLVRVDGVFGGVQAGRRQSRVGRGWREAGVDGGDKGEVVLVFVEVGRRGRESFGEGVEEGGVEWSEGQFVDDV